VDCTDGMNRTLTCLLVAAALLSACGSSTDRTGKPAQGRVTVLTFGNVNYAPGELQPFADEVGRLSGGHMRIRFLNDYRKGQVDQEKGVIDDVRAGKLDLGWAGARAFDRVGDTAFEAFQAPLLIDSYEAERAVLRSPVPAAALKTLEPLGVDGIGVLPGPLRKLVAVKRPIVEPGGLQGLRTAFSGGPATENALRTLGAEPVRIASGTQWDGWDAAEAQLGAIAGNHFEDDAHHLSSNVNLWPRFPVVFAGPSARAKLSSEQLALLRRAAVAAGPPGLAAIQDGERAAMKQLCRSMQVTKASPAQLEALRTASQPTYDSIARDAAAGPLLHQLESIRDGVDEPASAAPPCADGASNVTALDGTWVGSVEIDGELRRLRWVIEKGQYKEYELGGGQWSLGDQGAIAVYRDHFQMTSAGDGSMSPGRWSVSGDTLRVSDFSTPDPIGQRIFAGHAWTRATAPPARGIPDGTYVSRRDAEGPDATGKMYLELQNGDFVLRVPQKPDGHRIVGAEGTIETYRDHLTITTSDGAAISGRYALEDGVLRIHISNGPAGDKRVFNSYPFRPRR
jgi:TRAP-type C4-dicarboxylate transport system substrate-binding protein